MSDQAFEALKTFDWGSDPKTVDPIYEAAIAAHGDAAATEAIEKKLLEVLSSEAPFAAKDYVCRKLMLFGGAASVPALAGLLGDEHLSHMARYALERMPAPEAAEALRAAVGQVKGKQKIGVISSLGDREETDSVSVLEGLLNDSDEQVATAAAKALGAIRSGEAAKALAKGKKCPAVTDASLACAEKLLAAGKKGEALVIYKGFTGEGQPKHVRLAATRGMAACIGKKE